MSNQENIDVMSGSYGHKVSYDTMPGMFEIKRAGEVYAPRRDIVYNGPVIAQTILALIDDLKIYDEAGNEVTLVSGQKYDINKCFHIYNGEKYNCGDIALALDAIHKLVTHETSENWDLSLAELLDTINWNSIPLKARDFVLSMLGRCFLVSYFSAIIKETSKPELMSPKIWDRFGRDIYKNFKLIQSIEANNHDA